MYTPRPKDEPLASGDPMDAKRWHTANRAYLTACLERLRTAFRGTSPSLSADAQLIADARSRMSETPALDRTIDAFGLSTFERDVLLLALAPEVDAGFLELVAKARNERKASRPTLGVAMSYLDDPDWAALAPDAPLRRWGLVDLQPGPSLAQRALVCPERVLHHLLGVQVLEPELAARLSPVTPPQRLPDSRRSAVEACVASWSQERDDVVLLRGRDPTALLATAATAAAEYGGRLLRLRLSEIPSTAETRQRFVTQLGLEMALARSVLAVDAFDDVPGALAALRALAEDVPGPLVVVSRQPVSLGQVSVLRIEVDLATATERQAAWERFLPDASEATVDRFVSTFLIDAEAIDAIGARAGSAGRDALWHEARAHSRSALQSLAEPMQASATFDEIVLPEVPLTMLQDLVGQVRHRATVHERWGFAERNPRGLGVAALFAGPSGTGKTLAAEVIAHELDLDLFRVDLSRVGQRGDFERTLRATLDAAEAAGAVLLFDEADALFGRRDTRTPGGIDTHGWLEMRDLLPQFESYRGIAILTTNAKRALDPALVRRLRFIVDFPSPGIELRREIWPKVFPPGVRLDDAVDFDDLARLELPGGNIRNVALRASFVAAEHGEPVGLRHLQRAARAEYAMVGRNPEDVRLVGS